MRMPSFIRRGQTMVMFALTMLLMALLVTLTLSLGSRVKEKMEVQAAADAAAYSQAAQTARVFNEMALMSRAQIGHLVSQAAVQSLINWSSYYRAQVAASVYSYALAMIPYIMLVPCCFPYSGCSQYCGCAVRAISDISRSMSRLQRYESMQLANRWDQLERPAAQRSLRLARAAQQMFMLGHAVEYGRLLLELGGQDAADEIVQNAAGNSPWASEWSVDGDKTTMREAMPYTGAISWPALLNAHHVYATMGSRGHSFVANRGLIPMLDDLIIMASIRRNMDQRDQVFTQGDGSTYYSYALTHGTYTMATDTFSIADDHGINMITFNRGNPPCPTSTFGAIGAASILQSTDAQNTADWHNWFPTLGRMDMEPAQQRHNLMTCFGIGNINCPSVWPSFIDYNPLRVVDEGDAWGQPKNMAVIQRNYAARAAGQQDPWNYLFRLRYSGESDTGYDNRGIVLGPAGSGWDISRQTALSTGIAYYHRRDHWREPPNLLNPYWRATLVPATVDDSGHGDFKDELSGAGADWAAQTWQALVDQGYKGGP